MKMFLFLPTINCFSKAVVVFQMGTIVYDSIFWTNHKIRKQN